MKVLVTDGDSRAALAVTRSLGNAGHEVVVGEKHAPSLSTVSRYCSAAVVYPDPAVASEEFVSFMAAEVKARGIDVLVPVADITTFLVTGCRSVFGPSCAVPFADAAVIQRAANKVDILQTADALGIPIPRSAIVTSASDVPAIDFGYPLVIKPHQSRIPTESGWHASRVSYAADHDALRQALSARPAYEFPLMLQEQIVGPGVGVFAMYDRGKPVALFSHRRLREQPPSGGVSVLSESTPLPRRASEYATRLLDAIGWHGVAMVEFKHDLRDDTPKLMEINGRFWGSLQLAIDAGVDFPALLVESVHADRLQPVPSYRIGVRNRWFWGDVDSLLLSLFGSNGRTADQGSRTRAIGEFMKLWGKDLHYENPTLRDIKPGLLETYRWFMKGVRNAVPSAHAASGSASATSHSEQAKPKPVHRARATARIFTSLDKIGLGERAWNTLAAQSDVNSVFQTHQWTRSWLASFGDQFEPLIVAASDASGVAAVAPFIVDQTTSRERVVRFLGDGRADYCDVLSSGEKWPLMSAIFAAIRDSVDWDIIELNNLPQHSRTAEMIRALCAGGGYRAIIEERFACPTLMIDGRQDEARKILNKASLRRAHNYFHRTGRVVRRDLTTRQEIEPYLDRFFSQHVRRWDGTGSPSLFLNDRNQAFYRTLADHLSGTGWLVFSILELNDQPLAMHYGFDYDGSVIWYKPSFDITHAAHSPGLLMVRHLIDYAIGHERRELDFTVGDEPFKQRFTNYTRKTVRIQVFRDPARYMIERSRRTVLAAMRKTFSTVAIASEVWMSAQ
ncbi:MAG TPA: GNAT family N-acetyltransferase [Vicinamibacterales bacterium]|nr:GNAT family N-acetyltransferase [Vicinamibacterales bacterium]